jgi:hypothetical protein
MKFYKFVIGKVVEMEVMAMFEESDLVPHCDWHVPR